MGQAYINTVRYFYIKSEVLYMLDFLLSLLKLIDESISKNNEYSDFKLCEWINKFLCNLTKIAKHLLSFLLHLLLLILLYRFIEYIFYLDMSNYYIPIIS